MSEAYWIEWCKRRTRFYKAWGEGLRLCGPIMARREDERLLKLFRKGIKGGEKGKATR